MMKSIFLAIILFVTMLNSFVMASRPELILSEPIDAVVLENEPREYDFQLRSDEFVKIRVSDHSVNLTIQLYDPDGHLIASVYNLLEDVGEEDIYWIGRQSGTYKIEVVLPPKAPPQHYRIRIEQLRPAFESDRSLIAAQIDSEEAAKLLEQRDFVSVKSATLKLVSAYERWRDNRCFSRAAVSAALLGRVADGLKLYTNALEFHQLALQMWQRVSNQQLVADTLNRVAYTCLSLRDSDCAHDALTAALPIWCDLKDYLGERNTLEALVKIAEQRGDQSEAEEYRRRLSEVHPITSVQQAISLSQSDDVEEKRRGIDQLQRHLGILTASNDTNGLALVSLSIGIAYSNLDDQFAATKYLERALQLLRDINVAEGQIVALERLAEAWSELGYEDSSRNYLQDAMLLARKTNDHGEQCRILNSLGLSYVQTGDGRKAVELLIQAKECAHLYSDQLTEIEISMNLAIAQSSLGQKEVALTSLENLLAEIQRMEETNAQAVTLSNLSGIYRDLAEYEKSLSLQRQALALLESRGQKADIASGLNNMGAIYDDIGDKDKALSYFYEALPIIRKLSNKRKIATTLTNIGKVLTDINKLEEAKNALLEAAAIRNEINDKKGALITYNNLAVIHQTLGNHDTALNNFEKSIALAKEVGDLQSEGRGYDRIGGIYYIRREFSLAEELYSRALEIESRTKDDKWTIFSLAGRATARLNLGKLKDAEEDAKKAIDLSEKLLYLFQAPEFRSSYFASSRNLYDIYISILMAQYRDKPERDSHIKAFMASEQSRARSLLEHFVRQTIPSNTDIEPELAAEKHTLEQRLYFLRQMAARKRLSPISVADVELERQLQSLSEQLSSVEDRTRRFSPRYATLVSPMPPSVQDIQHRILDDDTLIVEFFLGSAQSYAWFITRDVFSSVTLPPRDEIDALAKEFCGMVNGSSRGYDATAFEGVGSRLREAIFADNLERFSKKRIAIVADGFLQMLPFAALPMPRRTGTPGSEPLLLDYEIISLPSVSAIYSRRFQVKVSTPTKMLAAFGDPVFSRMDPRVKGRDSTGGDQNQTKINDEEVKLKGSTVEQWGSLSRLPRTRTEVINIAELVPESERLIRFDFEANVTEALKQQLHEYRFVHFATHGFFDLQHPEFSGLALSMVDLAGNERQGLLLLPDIFNMNLTADVVVLSACETGLGKYISGEGTISLGHAFLYAGARKVVSSLWKVNSDVTADLMKEFYKELLGPKHSTATTALRQAALAVRTRDECQSPYFWAAFQVQGDWK